MIAQAPDASDLARGSGPTPAPVVVIGAGLAGCEAAWQIARRGVPVRLYEMKPERRSPAHHSADFAALPNKFVGREGFGKSRRRSSST